MKRTLILIIILFVNFNSNGQNASLKNCYEIKYLDFFGLNTEEIIKWPASEIDGLLATDFEKDRNGSAVKTNFIIPLIVYQLMDYHPDCNSEIDIAYLDKMLALYFKIREIDPAMVSDKAIAEKIDFIRADFYKQVESVEHLANMMLTFDDGPFYGVDEPVANNLDPNATQATEFGSILLSKVDDKTILTGKNEMGEILWRKSFTGFDDQDLVNLYFTENPIQYTSVATIAHMYSEGERLTLYLENDGSFMYYFHSW